MSHAKLSPSGASRWTSCTASPGEELGKPDSSSTAARAGSAKHLVSAECLEHKRDPDAYLGLSVVFGTDMESGKHYEGFDVTGIIVDHIVAIDELAVEHCRSYVNFIREIAGDDILMVEQRVGIEHITGEVGAKGTSDTVIVGSDTLTIADAKFGMVKVNAIDADGRPNKQLAMYADGALNDFGWMGEFEFVRMIIVQPLIHHVSELTVTVAELRAFIDMIRTAAEATRTAPAYVPSSSNCNYCKARRTCVALERDVITTVNQGDPLGDLYSKLPLVVQWIEDIKARTHEALSAGLTVERSDGHTYKLVIGKRGNRAWSDPAAVATVLKSSLEVKDMYSLHLISPADVEKLSKAKRNNKVSPELWATLQTLISQADGKPEVALSIDPRPAIASDFDDLTVTADSVDYFA